MGIVFEYNNEKFEIDGFVYPNKDEFIIKKSKIKGNIYVLPDKEILKIKINKKERMLNSWGEGYYIYCYVEII